MKIAKSKPDTRSVSVEYVYTENRRNGMKKKKVRMCEDKKSNHVRDRKKRSCAKVKKAIMCEASCLAPLFYWLRQSTVITLKSIFIQTLQNNAQQILRIKRLYNNVGQTSSKNFVF